MEVSWILAAVALLAAGASLARHRAGRRRLSRALGEIDRLDGELALLRRTLGFAAAGVPFRSQFGEDLILWEILGRARAGFFLEAGAYDGETLSISAAFEAMGWEGILVEPNPEQAARCALARPGARTINAALSRAAGVAELEIVNVGGDEWLSRMAGMDPPDPRLCADTRRVRVEATTLDAILAGAPRPIDLLILDVEGSELDALAGWDAKRLRARLALIEDTHNAREIADRMRAQGYIAAGRIGCSTLFIAGEERELLALASSMLLSHGARGGVGVGRVADPASPPPILSLPTRLDP